MLSYKSSISSASSTDSSDATLYAALKRIRTNCSDAFIPALVFFALSNTKTIFFWLVLPFNEKSARKSKRYSWRKYTSIRHISFVLSFILQILWLFLLFRKVTIFQTVECFSEKKNKRTNKQKRVWMDDETDEFFRTCASNILRLDCNP